MKLYPIVKPAQLSMLLLMGVMLVGCPKKESKTDPTPQGQLVGRWEMVSFIVSPGINGRTDLLAYLRQLYYFNCTDINYYYEFKSDDTFRAWSEAKCMSGTQTDEEAEFTKWKVSGNKLILSAPDGTQQEYSYTFKQGTAGKTDTQMTLQWQLSGSSYTATFNKI